MQRRFNHRTGTPTFPPASTFRRADICTRIEEPTFQPDAERSENPPRLSRLFSLYPTEFPVIAIGCFPASL